ncbi:MAG TPA: ATP-grasp domain-containing protein [Burkholderiaceae bacterium]|nr:ATP-grasp domain-containing protein [Burkholderiaceae bacterium]
MAVSDILKAATAAMQRTGDGAPVAYALDFGVLSTGQTVLVEANDAWALGLYGGGPAPGHYVELLTARWRQLLRCGIREMA